VIARSGKMSSPTAISCLLYCTLLLLDYDSLQKADIFCSDTAILKIIIVVTRSVIGPRELNGHGLPEAGGGHLGAGCL